MQDTALPRAPEISHFETGYENHLGLSFSPDGRIAFWVAYNGVWGKRPTSRSIIYWSRFDADGWSEPAPAPFSDEYSDSDPFVSPDGNWVYFVSNRPVDGEPKTDDDIWRYSLRGDARLEHLAINSGSAEFSPVVTANGTLYFASDRSGGHGQGDLYAAASHGTGFAEPRALATTVNSSHGEWNVWVSSDECEMLFEASGRASNVSVAGDLYYSHKRDGAWQDAAPVTELNTKRSELMPRLHPDGETWYYTSAATGGHAQLLTANSARIPRAAPGSGTTPPIPALQERRCQ